MKCTKCGKEFKEPPAISRIDKSNICSICAAKEAFDNAVGAGKFEAEDWENYKKLLRAE